MTDPEDNTVQKTSEIRITREALLWVFGAAIFAAACVVGFVYGAPCTSFGMPL